MKMDAKILVVDDEQAIADMVDIILHKEGFSNIDVCGSVKEAILHIDKNIYDFFILDIMLPDGTGLDLVKRIRPENNAPIFFLTAKVADADILRGFMTGADDYITKPFNPLELAARVKVHSKRYSATKNKTTSKGTFDYGRFQLNISAAELTVDGQKTILSGKLFHLLKLFCEHQGQVLSKEQIYKQVWGDDYFIDDNTIMVHIRKLREKIEVDPGRPSYLQTVRGIGYKLVQGE
ncbi:response regulator transcription factor [Viridibacillus sp. YIM B01967]|uniref:Response regulator transcription factor n=1 Tax=Viridibacillus soli TaxID=2798301 RepID=A0ABS1HCJ0_9BACL|nr:response regulator transcription factor [Viridibacillus soli]MBK3497140.1 response regulator transcription factor [Viridibacillus soli]